MTGHETVTDIRHTGGTVNTEGKYTDKFGRVLDVGSTVEVIKAEGEVHGVGEIVTLPPEGNDWHGFPYVRLHHSGKRHHISDNNLRLLYTDSLVGHLERAIATTQERNTALRTLADTLTETEAPR